MLHLGQAPGVGIFSFWNKHEALGVCVCLLAKLVGSPNLAFEKQTPREKHIEVSLLLRFSYPFLSLLIKETERFNRWMNHIRCLSGSSSRSILSLSHIAATRILAPTLIQVINRGRERVVPDCLISCHLGCSSSPQLEAKQKTFLWRWWGMKGWLAGWRVQLPVGEWIREVVEKAQMVLLFTVLNIHPSVVFLNPLKRTPLHPHQSLPFVKRTITLTAIPFVCLPLQNLLKWTYLPSDYRTMPWKFPLKEGVNECLLPLFTSHKSYY